MMAGNALSPLPSPNMEQLAMWVVGDRLFVGYGRVETLEDLIKLCRQTAQYVHVCSTISTPEGLEKFTKVMDGRLAEIRLASSAITKDLTNGRLRELLLRCLGQMVEITPLLNNSVEVTIATGNERNGIIAAESRDCFKQQLLENLRDFVLLLQLVSNGKPAPGPASHEEDSLHIATGYLKGNSSVLSYTGLEAIKKCIQSGRGLVSILQVGVDKGDLMAACSQTEHLAQQYIDCQGVNQRSTLAIQLSEKLVHLRERMTECLSRKIVDDFLLSDGPIERLEKAALSAHFKPQRGHVFSERKEEFEQLSSHMTTNINLACKIQMVSNAGKIELIGYLSTRVSAMSHQVVCAAKLLLSNPYNDVFKNFFTAIKKEWLRRVERLRAVVMAEASLRTYEHYKDNRSYVTCSIMSPSSKYTSRVDSSKAAVVRTDPETVPVREMSPLIKKEKREAPSWESADKDLVQAARMLAMIVCRLSELARNQGFTSEKLIGLSKDIVRACDMVSRLTHQLAADCTDKHHQSMLLKFCERIPTFATQLKMVCTVKAATLGSPAGNAEGEEATEMLLENARNLMATVRETVHTAAAAAINIRVALAQYAW